MRTLLSWIVFPFFIVAGVAGTVALFRSGLGPGLSVFIILSMVTTPLLLIEGWMPYRQSWRRRLVRSGTDVVHLLFTAATTELFRALTFGGMVMVAAWVASLSHGTLWPNHWPIAVQLVIAMVIGDFGTYWVHRLAHAGPLWSIHAMHHTSDKLSTLSSGRNHPLNAVAAYASAVTPLILMGAGTEVLMTVGVFTGIHGMLQHCNADLRHGWLNYVFATADLHRWHHSTVRGESDTNFGSNLVIWDHVFGTFELREERGPEQVGLSDVAMPENVWVHLATPWSLAKWAIEATGEVSPAASEG